MQTFTWAIQGSFLMFVISLQITNQRLRITKAQPTEDIACASTVTICILLQNVLVTSVSPAFAD